MPTPFLVVNPVPNEPQRARLVDAMRPIVPHAPINGDRQVDERWLFQGITWTPEPNRALFTNDVDGCNTILQTDFPAGCEPAVSSTPFSVYDAFRGSALEYNADDIEALLDGRLTIKTSAAIASELITNAAANDGSATAVKGLSAKATAAAGIALGTSAPIYKAMALLENEMASRQRGGLCFIHMPPGLLSQAVYQCELELNAQGLWETPLGNIVIADAGYVNMPKPAASGTPGVAGTADWVYASGIVCYAIAEKQMTDQGNIGSTITTYTGREDPTKPDPIQHSFVSRNQFTRFCNTYAILQFNPNFVTAVLTNYAENS